MENTELIWQIISTILGAGFVFTIYKFVIKPVFRFLKSHNAIGKNIDNSHVEPGATVNKIIGDNAIMNVGTQTYYQDEEPCNAKQNDVWISPKNE